MLARQGAGPGDNGSTFSPSDVAGLWLWAKSESLDGLSDGAAISQWNDSSGNARHLTQGTGANQPIKQTVGGKSVARFDGANHRMAVPNASALTAATVFIVVKVDADPAAGIPTSGLWDFGSDAANDTHYPFTDGIIYDDFGTTARKTTVNPTPALTSPRNYCVISAASDWRSYLDGSNLHTTATNTVGFLAAPLLGRGPTNPVNLDGDVHELILYSSALSDGNRQSVEGYLRTKFTLS